MVPLPVLQEDVKVFLGEYRFEPPDTVRQSKRYSLCLWGWAILSEAEGEREGVSIGSWISVLTSSMSNTANLLTSSNQGTLFAGCAKQNPLPELSKLPLPLLHPLGPLNLQSIPSSAPRLTSRHPSGRDSPSWDGWPLRTNSTCTEVKRVFSRLRLCP